MAKKSPNRLLILLLVLVELTNVSAFASSRSAATRTGTASTGWNQLNTKARHPFRDFGSVSGFRYGHGCGSGSPFIARMAASGSTGDSDELLETASRLRREAEEMEESVRKSRSSSDALTGGANVNANKNPPAAKYTTLKNSSWTISYRFASDAVSKDDNDDANDDDDAVKNVFYSGKLNIFLTDDGYTNILDESNESTSSSGSTPAKIKFTKIWGWDEENSKEDELDYLLFSADVALPKSDPTYSSKNPSTRYYFQTQIIQDAKSGEISLVDGTVTMKKDVKPPGGFWGVFNAGGILAQFRYCGEFLMKPL